MPSAVVYTPTVVAVTGKKLTEKRDNARHNLKNKKYILISNSYTSIMSPVIPHENVSLLISII